MTEVLGRDACPEECIALEIPLNVIGHIDLKEPDPKTPHFLAPL
jgi:hypothetical protein